MANFDAIRTSHLSALEYLCKPTPPPELLACFPLNNSTEDKSRYHASIAGTLVYADSDYFAGTKRVNNTPFDILLPQSLDLSEPWSLDCVEYKTTSGYNASVIFTFGGLKCYQSSDYQSYKIEYGGSSSESPSLVTPAAWIANTNHPFALRYDGNGSLQWFTFGNLRYTHSIDLSSAGSINSIAVTFIGAYSHHAEMQNLRVVQKALGTSSSYPTPSDLYTGLEPI